MSFVTDMLALIFSLILGLRGLEKSEGPLQCCRSEIIRVEARKGEWELKEGERYKKWLKGKLPGCGN